MTTKSEKADDDIDTLEALASEEKEFNKVCPALPSIRDVAQTLICAALQDAEIDRILKAFRLDA
jgi:hypothetical protein